MHQTILLQSHNSIIADWIVKFSSSTFHYSSIFFTFTICFLSIILFLIRFPFQEQKFSF